MAARSSTTWRTTRSRSASSSASATPTRTSVPYEEFQRYKTHPAIRGFLEGGKRIAYGARAITAGGLQSLPKLVFPGGCLIGDDAGFLNASRIKGTPLRDQVRHARRRGGASRRSPPAARATSSTRYPEAFRQSWLFDELYRARNFKPWMSEGPVHRAR